MSFKIAVQRQAQRSRVAAGPEGMYATQHSESDTSTSGISLEQPNSARAAETTPPQTASVYSNGSIGETDSFATADDTASDTGAGSRQPREASRDTRVSIDEHVQPPSTESQPPTLSAHPSEISLPQPAGPASASLGWWQTVRTALIRIPLFPRMKVLALTPLAYAQIIAGIVILGLSAHEKTDQPLRAFVVLHIVRLFLYYPLYISHKLWPHEVEACGRGFKSWHKG
ncbi:hypothetical protein IWW50_004015 [Coemansia erecta]|nr:hypothetical protein IWW50_004015 [Coemansia erecta]